MTRIGLIAGALFITVAFLSTILSLQTNAFTADQFVTRWTTTNNGSSNNNSIRIPLVGTGYRIDWTCDGTYDLTVTSNPSNYIEHNYGAPGTYQVCVVDGPASGMRFWTGNRQDREKLIRVENWGTTPWNTLYEAFYGATNVDVDATQRRWQ